MQIVLWSSTEVEILFISILLYLHHCWSYGSTYQERKWHTMWKKWDEGRGWSCGHFWKRGSLSSTVKYTGAKDIQERACIEVLLYMPPNCEVSEVLWCCFMFRGVWFCTLLSQFSNIYIFATQISFHLLLLLFCTGVHLILWWAGSESATSKKGITVSVVHLCELAHNNVRC